MSATVLGVENAFRFVKYSELDTALCEQVDALLQAQDWAGVVNLAQQSSFNYEALPFTADDVEMLSTPWVIVGIPEDYAGSGDLAGGLAAIRSTGAAMMLLRDGGIVTSKNNALLATRSSSVSPGQETSERLDVPLVYADGSGISDEPSDWRIAETDQLELVFSYRGEPRVVMTADRVWTRQHREAKDKLDRSDGDLYSSSRQEKTIGEDLFTLFKGERFTIAMTCDGHLVVRDHVEDLLAHVVRASGKMWGRAEQGFYNEDDLSFGLDELIAYLCEEALEATVDLAVSAWETSYAVANDLVNATEDAIDEVLDEVVEVGQDAVDVVEDVANKVADTTKDVANEVADTTKDVADEVADTTKDVANEVADTTKDAVNEVENVAKDVADALTSW